jgi:uncharacterized hydrophobic protein (TIGR00271 family)
MIISLTMEDWRNRFAASLGVGEARKPEIYLDISKAATLKESSYWLQLLFSAGVATMGLVLNSPAVIIGAMLISPLMGPILSAGLSLATGDLILGVRAIVNLFLSCLVAISFSVLLVALIPFKEMTAEIVARTQPNTLDLIVALFSGAIGSIAVCRETKGVVTSIPGVAIAVALMPPLCVVGYGIGLALSFDSGEGMRAARGGGLLFLTNLVAISFTAMLVFLAVHLDTTDVREKVREWRKTDQESAWVRRLLSHYRITEKLGAIGGIPGRLFVILIPLVLILIPLSISLSQLKQEIAHKQAENNIRKIATELWQQYFTTLPGGDMRSFIDQLAVSSIGEKQTITLRVFDNQSYSEAEKNEFIRLFATKMGIPTSSVNFQLIEIPTSSALIALRARQEKRVEAPPSISALRLNYKQSVESALTSLVMPQSSKYIGYRLIIRSSGQAQIYIVYLSQGDLGADAQELIAEEVRSRFNDPTAQVFFERVPVNFDTLTFRRNITEYDSEASAILDRLARLLSDNPGISLELVSRSEKNANEKIADDRIQKIIDRLTVENQISKDRIITTKSVDTVNSIELRLVKSAVTEPPVQSK